MKRASITSVLVFALLIAFASVAMAQMAKKGWEKTVTLPSGEVILDLKGEWNMYSLGYGPFFLRPSITDILTITQEGATFTAVKQIGSKWVPKGAEIIKGELDKDGFKSVYHYIHAKGEEFIWEPCNWEITENGNEVVLDCGERIQTTLTRR